MKGTIMTKDDADEYLLCLAHWLVVCGFLGLLISGFNACDIESMVEIWKLYD